MIWTLDAIKQEMDEVAGQWNGDESGKQEEDAQAAKEVLDLVARIEDIMRNELQYTITSSYEPL
jgi:hypothetical protein